MFSYFSYIGSQISSFVQEIGNGFAKAADVDQVFSAV